MEDEWNSKPVTRFDASSTFPSEDLGKRTTAHFQKEIETIEPGYRDSTTSQPLDIIEDLQIHQIKMELQIEQVREEQAKLEESRKTLLDLYENAPVGYLSIAKDGKVTRSNLTAASILGVDKRELFGRLLTQFICPDDLNTFLFNLQEAFDTGL
jgi:PAS domain-containing protein